MRSVLIAGLALAITSLTSLSANAALLLHYEMNEGSGTTLADTGAGPAAPGTLVNGAWSTNTPGGASSASVNTSGAAAGNLKYVSASDAAGEVDKLDALSSFTLTTWVNLAATPNGNRRLLAKQAPTTFSGFSWNFSDPGNGAARSASAFGMRLFVGGETGFTFDGVPAGNPAFVVDANNKWAFLAVSYDGTSTFNNVNYYAGSADGSVSLLATTTVNAGTTVANAAAFTIGHTDAGITSDTSIPGLIDDSRVYSGALSLSEVEGVRLQNVPEPAALSILALGALAFQRRRRERA